MSKRLLILISIAFLLRLGLGAGAYFFLPSLGHSDSKPQQAGYLFLDAFRRDNQSFDLAQSGKPLEKAFSGKFESDQYGGLLWLSAFLYRYATGGSHQPLLVIFLAALVGSLGGIFVFRAGQRLLDEKSAWLATAIFLFYPEAILQGASQMREPFLMTFLAMFFYGIVDLRADRPFFKNPAVYALISSLLGMLTFSPGIALLALISGGGWLYFGGQGGKLPWQVLVGAALVFVIAVIALSLSWDNLVRTQSGPLGVLGDWARETAKWNQYVLKRSSGIVQLVLEWLPEGLRLPFVGIYGILQPVLPAALAEASTPFWQAIGVLRALGWYLLLPWVAYAVFSVWSLPTREQQRAWAWLALVTWAWIVIVAVRGGGDQWDNPRYRVIALCWMALLAAQAFSALRSPAGRWFWRIAGVLGIILLVFGHWYSYRYLQIGFNLGIRNTLGLAIGSAVLLVLVDLAREKWQRR